jgi:TPR repeat protein
MRQKSNKKVVDLSSSIKARLEKAITAFEAGDQSPALLDELRELINKGSKEANYYVGMIYEDGANGVEKSLEFAFFYYQKSTEGHGYVQGNLALARMHYHGVGVPRNYATAFEYYEHIAKQNDNLVACFMLGRMYQHGEGVERDLTKARECYARAISKGSVYGMLNLAMLEAAEGRWLKSIALRAAAGWAAFRISRKNPGDPRLRGG